MTHQIKTTPNTTRRSLTVLAVALMTLPAATQAAGPDKTVEAEIARTIGFVPSFAKALPTALAPGYFRQVKEFELAETALPAKVKALIGLAVAAQTSSRLTTYSYGKCAQANGAGPAETGEAIGIAALARHWSTLFNGLQIDEAKFRGELGKLRENVMKAAASGAKPPKPGAITDAKSALKDVEQMFGFVPEFLKRLPAEALPGAWLSMRDVEMGPTALPGKTKTLISLAVASQIPCRYCIIADTEFAKLEGATDREISEAVTMAAMAREYITLIDGAGLDETDYRRDWDRITSGGRKAQGAGKAASRMATK